MRRDLAVLALGLGLVVGNLIHPGEGLALTPYDPAAKAELDPTVAFVLEIIPDLAYRQPMVSGRMAATMFRWPTIS